MRSKNYQRLAFAFATLVPCFRRIQSLFSTSLLSLPILPFRSLISKQASSAFYEISNFHVILDKPSKVTLLRRRIGCREAVACDPPLAVSLSEDKQFLISFISFATTLNDGGTGRVGPCILSAGIFIANVLSLLTSEGVFRTDRYDLLDIKLDIKFYDVEKAFVCLAHIGDADE